MICTASRGFSRALLVLMSLMFSLLVACGGGGGGSVVSPPLTVPVSITTQPTDASVTAGSSATFAMAATGTPTPTVQWQVSTNGGASFTDIVGATAPSYTTPTTNSADNARQYRATVSNSSGAVNTRAAVLTVVAASTAPQITTQPLAMTVVAPGVATFSVVATGNPTPSYRWQQSTDSGVSFADVPNATAATLTTTALGIANNNLRFRVVVSNAAGSVTSDAVLLTVTAALAAPSMTAQPSSTSVTAPTPATFTAAATGNPAPSYQWQTSLDGGATFSNITGATNPSYATPTTTLADNGKRYRVVASNSQGSVSSAAATLSVNAALAAPSLISQPLSISVTAPAAASFSVAASGNPAPSYQWQISVDAGISFSNIAGATGTTYALPATALADSGNRYRVLVNNSQGNVFSGAATLTVSAALAAPIFNSQPQQASVTAPAVATFTASATGNPAPSYQWQLSLDGGATFSHIAGAISSSYATPTTTSADNGKRFRVVASNSQGSVASSAALLSVTAGFAAPTFTNQPSAASVTAPAAASFNAVAAGLPAPTYQWQHSADGGSSFANIAGATASSFTTPATTVADNGKRYRVVASNSQGSVISTAALLTVMAEATLMTGRAVDSASAVGVQGVTVRVGAVSATTDANGAFSLAGATPGTRVTVVFTSTTHAENARIATLATGTATDVQVRLVKVGQTADLAIAAGGTVSVAGSSAQVVLPSAAMQRADGAVATGTMRVRVTPIDPATDTQVMPGDFTTMVGATPVPIESFGALNVQIADATGATLNLRSGLTATVRIPVASRNANPPATIPLFHFDNTSGRWVQEGTATLTGTAPNRYYQGTVSHFSTWNADVVMDTVRLTGCLTDALGNRVAGARVYSDGIDYSGVSNVVTDALGRFVIPIRRNAAATLVGLSNGRLTNTFRIGPYSVDSETTTCLSLAVTGGGITMKLTWGERPSDLDSHLITPSGDHIYYPTDSRGNLVAPPFANLDVDDTTSYGPEVVTITKLMVGTYKYFVFNFSRYSAWPIGSASASVELNIPGRVAELFTPPSTGESIATNFWTLFELDVDAQCNVTVRRANAYSSLPPSQPLFNTPTYCSR